MLKRVSFLARAAMTLLLTVLCSTGAWATITGDGTQDNPYVIADANDWETFVNWIRNYDDKGDKCYKLGADITISSMAGVSYNKFRGTFDGTGHTLNLNGLTSYSQFCAPFRYVDGATFKRIHTTGTVIAGNSTSSDKYRTGLVGESSGNTTIINCWSSVTISSQISGDGTHGGFVGVVSGGTLTITNCLFDGSISGDNTNSNAGFVGWTGGNTTNITNCLMAGTISDDTTNGATFIRGNSDNTASNIKVNNSYYNTAHGTVQGTAVGNMSNDDLLTALGDGWEISNNKVVPIISAKYLSFATISGLATPCYTWTGSPIAVNYTVKDGNGNTLTQGEDYTATISPTTVQDVGDYTLTITGKGSYSGTKVVTFKVRKVLPGSGTVTDPYLIGSDTDWETFVGWINNDNSTYTNKYYKLTADINVTSMAGTSDDNSFIGTFDGDGHTMTINLTSDADYCAPFCYCGSNTTFKRLHIAGTINTSHRYAAGLVARQRNNTLNIINCWSSVTINTSTDSYFCAGFVGNVNGNTNITNCLFDGKLLGSAPGCCAGLIGHQSYSTTINTTNCLYAPTEVTVSTSTSSNSTLVCLYGSGSTANITNCYYTETLGDEQGTAVGSMTNEELKQALGIVWEIKNNKVVPVLDIKNLAGCTLTCNSFIPYTGSEITLTPTIKDMDGNTVAPANYNISYSPSPVQAQGNYTMTVTGNANGYSGTLIHQFQVANQLPGSGTSSDPYRISSTDDWNTLAAAVAGGIDFFNEYVRLDADITISTMVGVNKNYSFKGRFYGNNKTLTVNIENTDPSVEGAAPFRYFKGDIYDLKVTGNVTSAGNYAGGMVGFAGNGVRIENCVVTTAITTSAMYAGGFIGNIGMDGNPNVNFTGCVFAGSITNNGNDSYRYGGGFFGAVSGYSYFTDCLENGTYTNLTLMNPRGANNFFSNKEVTSLYYVNKIGSVEYISDNNGCHQVVTSVPTSDIYQTRTIQGYTFYQPAIINGLHDTYIYNNGDAVNLGYSLMMGKTAMTEDTDYEVTINDADNQRVNPSDLKAVGTYTISFAAKTGNEAGYVGQTATYTFSIIAEGESLDGYVFAIEGEGDQKVYLINNEEDLERLAAYVNSGHNASGKTFKLNANITMTGEHTAIGNYNNKFRGTFDGGNNTITNLLINRPQDDYQGLFGYVYEGGTVKNVNLNGCDITGMLYVGGIVGRLYSGTITNCHVNGAIKATVNGAQNHGGIVGYSISSPTITDCTVTGTISTQYNGDAFGGIVGYLGDVKISNCENAASISGPGNYHGGLIGFLYSGSTSEKANNCLNMGTVEGTENVGAISGNYYDSSNFKNCFYTSPCVTQVCGNYASDMAGKAERAYFLNAGDHVSDITVSETASFTSAINGKKFYKKGNWTVTLTPNAPDGYSAVSYTCEGGTLTNATTLDGTHTLTISGGAEVVIGALLSSNNATDIANATIADIADHRWLGNVAITPAVNITYNNAPLTLDTDYIVEYSNNSARGTATITVRGINNYKGTTTKTFKIKDFPLKKPEYSHDSENPYLISTAEDLEALASIVNTGARRDGYYLQTADISLNNQEHTPIGNYNNRFNGTYDGGNKIISYWHINKPDEEYVGLFGYVNACINNVIVDNCTIIGKAYVGGIVGCSYSTIIYNCFSNATVQGNSYVGSIMGWHNGNSSNNFHSSTTTGGIGSENETIGHDIADSRNDAEIVVKITAGDGVTLTLPEEPTYEWNGEKLYKSGTVVTLNYALPENMIFDRYAMTSGTVRNASTMTGEHTLTGFTSDVVITGSYVSDYTNLQEAGATIASISGTTYNRYAYKPVPVVTMGNETLVEGTDYSVSYSDECINAGEHTVTATGLGKYTGSSVSQTFTIARRDINNCYIHVNDQAYTGDVITATPSVSYWSSSDYLEAGEDKDFTFTTNPATVQALGDYTVTVTGQGNYTGTKEASFKVIYGVPSNLVCNGDAIYSAYLTWQENGVATQWTVEYSTDDTFATSERVTVDATDVTLKRLTPGTVYYARVKAVYGVGEESDWSNVVSFTPSRDVLAIGSGTSKAYNLPFNTNYKFNLTEQIYTADEMGAKSRTISSISFYKKGTVSCQRTIAIYLVNTEKSSFSSDADLIHVTNSDKVFDGTVSFVHDNWTTITLDTLFAYDGSKNLAIIVDDNHNSDWGERPDFASTSTGNTCQALSFNKDNTNFDPENYAPYQASSYSMVYEKNNVRIGLNSTEIVLANDDREAETLNSIIIADNDGQTRNVTLADRTLYKDGDWNTICLPFDVTLADSPLAGATAKTLTEATMTDYHFELTFGDDVEILSAGVPYIIRWNAPDLIIKTTDDWNAFADNVTNGTEDYSGKVVRLDADIEISKMAGSSTNMFKGTFNGNGHTLTLDSLSTDPDEEYCAPFRYVENATICNLHTDGTVIASTKKYRSGLIGMATAATINNCWSSVNIESDIPGDGTHGGFIGTTIDGNTTINNCRFDGSITGNNTNCCGGFVGWGTVSINNSLFAPTAIGLKEGLEDCYTFGRRTATVNNSYYTETLGAAQGTSASGMSNDDLLTALGSGWQEKNGKVIPVMEDVITNPVFTNVTIVNTDNSISLANDNVKFIGNYDAKDITSADKDIYYLTAGNKLKRTGINRTLGGCRAYFQFSNEAAARQFILKFGDGTETGETMSLNDKGQMINDKQSDAWYTIDGRKLAKKPTKKGLYIFNGHKTIVE